LRGVPCRCRPDRRSSTSSSWDRARPAAGPPNACRALVCAGRPLKDVDYTEHKQPYDLKYRGRATDLIRRTQPTQKDCYACTEYNADWFCNDLEEPYTTATGKPFSWQGRMRVTGGRTNVWGRQSYRFSQQDMKGASFDGFGIDWPLDYKDLAPYYDLVEDYVGISGLAENLDQLPDSRFQPAMAFTCAEQHARDAIKGKLGRTLTIGRVANLTTPVAPSAISAARVSAAVRRTRTSTRRSPPSPTRSRPAGPPTFRTRWSTRS
jgi:choline dehydrogenase-like flavoprotein